MNIIGKSYKNLKFMDYEKNEEVRLANEIDDIKQRLLGLDGFLDGQRKEPTKERAQKIKELKAQLKVDIAKHHGIEGIIAIAKERNWDLVRRFNFSNYDLTWLNEE